MAIASPVEGHSDPAETSRDGLARMRRLHTAAIGPSSATPTQGDTKLIGSQRGAVHPQTQQLVYSSPSGLLAVSLEAPLPPRSLPTPPLLGPGRDVSISPCGRWIVVFHPAIAPPGAHIEGGTLAIYSSALLSPAAAPTSLNPLASFQLPSAPISTVHLFPDRLFTPSGRAKPLGPPAPADYNPENGPCLVIMTRTGALLVHPQQQISPALLSSQGGMAQLVHARMVWGMGLMRVPLATKSFNRSGDMDSGDVGWKCRSGWINLVEGSEGVWAGWEKDGETGVTRIDVGHEDGRFFTRTTPMPSLPSLWTQISGPNDTLPVVAGSPSDRRSELQGMSFVSLGEQVVAKTPAPGHTDTSKVPPKERVGVVLIFRESQRDVEVNRIEIVELRLTQLDLSDAFEEVEPNSSPVSAMDWITLQQPINTAILPQEMSILAVHFLPNLSGGTVGLALLDTADGIILSHVDVMPDSSDDFSLFGEAMPVHSNVEVEFDLITTQTVQRGCTGLVTVLGEHGKVVFFPSPLMSTPDEKVDKAAKTAEAIVLGLRQDVGWGDAVRVAFATTSKGERRALAVDILNAAAEQLSDSSHLLWIQTSVFSAINDERRHLSFELLDLTTSLQLFARSRRSNTTYSTGNIFSLLALAEHVGHILAEIFREWIEAKSQLQLAEDPSNNTELPTNLVDYPRLVYLSHPDLRVLLLKTMAACHNLLNFVRGLEMPIPGPPPGGVPSASADAGLDLGSLDATLVARERAQGLMQSIGIDLQLWGKVIGSIHRDHPKPTEPLSAVEVDALRTSYTLLSIDPLTSLVNPADLVRSIPNPSALFIVPPSPAIDTITFSPLSSTKCAICVRCGRTTALMTLYRALGSASNGNDAQGAWSRWVRERARGCVCGGTWAATDARKLSP